MANILDSICPEGFILDGLDDWPSSAMRIDERLAWQQDVSRTQIRQRWRAEQQRQEKEKSFHAPILALARIRREYLA